MEKLALLGGTPVRKEPFKSSAVIDEDEVAAVTDVLKTRELSRFMGSSSDDIEQQLSMESAQAVNYGGQEFLFLGGRKVRQFEADFAQYFGVKYAITVNSATSGLSVALAAAGVGPGDEVITTCLSFNATGMSILLFNSIPVFVDISKGNFCLDPREVKEAISPQTKAILVVHLMGHAADMDAIMKIAREHNLAVVEDCAQAPGTKHNGQYVGTIGDTGFFSFQDTKNMVTGEGGIIITNNPKYARRCRLIRNHGESIPDDSIPPADLVNIVGFNFRMTELIAAVGSAQLKKLDENNRVRNENARFLAKELSVFKGIEIPDVVFNQENVIHIITILYHADRVGVSREMFVKALRTEGIPVGTGYARIIPDNPIFQRKVAYGKDHCPFSCPYYGRDIDYGKGLYPVARDLIKNKQIAFHIINRPNNLDDMKDIVKAFKKVYSNIEQLKQMKTITPRLPINVERSYG
jgi:dTDP-4-amino-4,6-dideoxygalactose transaminase